jgi:hypothetical protein
MSKKSGTRVSSETPREYSSQPYFVAKFVLVFIAVVVTAGIALLSFTTLSTPTVLQAINIIVSVLLTGALIILYRDLSVIQSRQVRAMEASYTPVVGIKEWEITDKGYDEDSSGASERLVLTLSNEGNSIARDLRIWFAISYETPEGDPHIYSLEVPASRTEGKSWWRSGSGGTLPQSSTDVRFYATPTFLRSPSGPEQTERIRFDKMLRTLSSAGVKELQLAFSLRYNNAAGDEAEIDFAATRIDLGEISTQDTTLRDIIAGKMSNIEEIKANARTAT